MERSPARLFPAGFAAPLGDGLKIPVRGRVFRLIRHADFPHRSLALKDFACPVLGRPGGPAPFGKVHIRFFLSGEEDPT
jgi:hypothetical protein